jgi:rhamnopyranosyl-N-acetylglucosaminyl-diphospho-decaprenol beta-1,3/1,4-galactofuranosyltransferase
MKIAAVIVTCNRKQKLSDLLEDFSRQNLGPESILVIDNASEDGTAEHVEENYPFVDLIKLQQNQGLFGGLEKGITTAMARGLDAVWLVDDDARLREDTFEKLYESLLTHDHLIDSVVWSANVTPGSQFFTEPVCIKVDGEWKIYHEFLSELNNKIYEGIGGPNIGVYIPRKVIEKIGPPRSDMIFCGEDEFIYRVKRGGISIYRCFTSIVYHKKHDFFKIKMMGKTRYVSKAPPWHTYYEMRNRIYTDLSYKRRTFLKSLLYTVVDSMIKLYICDDKITTFFYISRAVYDGIFRHTGMRVSIPRPLQVK